MSTLKVGTIQDHANSNTAITIDSAGRVLKPVIPYGQASSGVVTNAGSIIQLTANVISGGGITVDQTNERMIVPVAGLYAIGFSQLTDSTSANTEVYMRKNGTRILGTSSQTHAGNDYDNLSCHFLITLAANDYIDWYVNAGVTHNNTGYNSHYVYLLG